MKIDDIDYDEIINDLSPKNKLELFFKLNHYVIGPVTIMDICILLLVFFGVGYTINTCLHLTTGQTLVIVLALCSFIEYFRIKWRRVKTIQYAEKKAAHAKKLLEEYASIVERIGSEEDRQRFRALLEKTKQADEMLHELSDLTYEKDVLGLSDED